MFLAMAIEKGYNIRELRGSVQNDVTMEEVVRCGFDFIPPKPCFRLQCDNVEYIRSYLPKWSPVTLNGYNLRDAGCSDVLELAVALSNGLETISELQKRGYDPSFISSRIAFFWSIGNNFFNEVARLRAVRKVWCGLLTNRFSITDTNALKLKCHTQTSGITLTRQEPYNNIIRSSFQALAAILGGVQSLHVDSYDEAYSVPSEESALISLRTQQILQSETGITDIVDPLGGSYYIEQKTLEYEKLINDKLDWIDSLGGYISLVESGRLHKELADFSYEQQQAIDKGEIKIVGLNQYCLVNPHSISSFNYPEGVEERQISFLSEVKNKRDRKKVDESLDALEEACASGDNIFPYCVDCAINRCTKGEMFLVFKKVFGLWSKPGV
jgi:methylmalonyl-CoA mutase N-terminal domain/subunit